jgi:hypothetical protein
LAASHDASNGRQRRVEWPAKMSIVVMDPFNELFGQRAQRPGFSPNGRLQLLGEVERTATSAICHFSARIGGPIQW